MELADLLEGIYFIGQIPEWRIISLTIPSLGGDANRWAWCSSSTPHKAGSAPLFIFTWLKPGKKGIK